MLSLWGLGVLLEIVMTTSSATFTPLDELTEVRGSGLLKQASECQLLANRSDGRAKQQYEQLARRLWELAMTDEGPR
jgi:hypothetical protein